MSSHNDEIEESPQSARKQLYEIYANSAAKSRAKKRLIESLDEIYGYDILFLVGLIMKSDFSGELNIINQHNVISGITFSLGKITRIDLNDKDTFMGELLIQDGYLTREQLSHFLQDKSKPLGEILLNNKIITPEQIILTLIKQIRLRLSRFIDATKYRVNFSETDPDEKPIFITYNDFLELAHDQIAGRFSVEWLKLHYMDAYEGDLSWINQNPTENISQLPLMADLKKVLSQKTSEIKLSNVADSIKSDKDREYFFKCVHFGVMSGELALIYSESGQNETTLKKIYQACSNKTGIDLLETLAHIVKCKPTEIDLIFQSINNHVIQYTGDDLDMKNNMFRIVLDMLSKKDFYSKEVEKKYSQNQPTPINETQIQLSIQSIFTDLVNKKGYAALDKLKRISQFSATTPKIKLYMIWTKCLVSLENNIKINLADLERDFLQILPEDKETADYYYTKTLLHLVKKEKSKAEESYQKAVKLNPVFKNYSPIKSLESFMKNLFKFSVLALTISHLLMPYSARAASTEKPPFVYLNQYFEYKIQNSESIKINDKVYSLLDLIENTENIDGFKADLNISTEAQLCTSKTTSFTKITACKQSKEKLIVSQIEKSSINDMIVENSGQVILTDNETPVVFKAHFKDGSQFEISTIKRVVLPVKIQKESGSEDFNIVFKDTKLDQNNSWTESINFNQSYFEFKKDALLNVRQGIYFNDNVNASTAYSRSFIIAEDNTPKFNFVGIEPIFVFNELNGKSNEINATLRSNMGLGLAFTLDKKINDLSSYFGHAQFYTTTAAPANNAATIVDDTIVLMGLEGGYRRHLNDKWSLSALARYKEEMFFNKLTSSSVLLTKTFTQSLGIQPEYQFYQNKLWTVKAQLAAYLMLPNAVSNSTDTELGYNIEAGINAVYKMRYGKVGANMTLGNRSQKNSIYSYNDSLILYRLNLMYGF